MIAGQRADQRAQVVARLADERLIQPVDEQRRAALFHRAGKIR